VTTLVLLPGMDGTGVLFEPFVSSVKADVIVVAYPGDQPLGYAELEQRVWAVLPKEEPFILLGESFSGPLAIAIAAKRPPNLRALVLVCTFAKLPLPWIPAWLQKLVGKSPVARVPVAFTARTVLGPFYTRPLYGVLKKVHDMVTPAVWNARLLAVMNIDQTALLPRIEVPVLYLQAIYDKVVSASASELISRHLPQTELVAFESPHFLLQVMPAEAAAAVRKFAQAHGIDIPYARH
jgi:pimeloyl-[acyl-carrier protein] methyl ester esterase